MQLSPDDVRDVLRALDSSGLDEMHLEVADWSLTVRREGAQGWTAEQKVLREPVQELGPQAQHLGNFPQAFTHLALISAAFDLDRRLSAAGHAG